MNLIQLALEHGAHKAAQISPAALRYDEKFLQACQQNVCGRYGKNYTCPPHVGDIRQLITKLQACQHVVLWQTVSKLDDSFDFEGMQAAQRQHNAITIAIADAARAQLPDAIALGAGGCFLCHICAAQTNEPCRFPARAISSLEAHGVDVSSIEQACDLKYMNGTNTVTYFSGLFCVQSVKVCANPLPSARNFDIISVPSNEGGQPCEHNE
ncbi:MAG: DUF2284 domain-containing protein [Oscillospiraceae bacterium]|nr:DUF2284 domain-containing protein [Oscillospiraceae bacterium]